MMGFVDSTSESREAAMQLKDLRTFQAIADIGSLHGAADALGVT